MTTALVLTLPVTAMVVLGLIAKMAARSKVIKWEAIGAAWPTVAELPHLELEHHDGVAVSEAA